MAALLSASLPAAPVAQAASSSSAPSSTAAGGKRLDAAKDVIPAELKGGLDVEAQIAVTGVEVDGMVSLGSLLGFLWLGGGGEIWEGGEEGERGERESSLPSKPSSWEEDTLVVGRIYSSVASL